MTLSEEAAGVDAGGAGAEPEPEPVIPPVAPVAAMRVVASASVVQAMVVPALATRGRARQVSDELHEVSTNFPLTHCAKFPPIQACSPSVQEESALRVANLALRAWASLPFWSWKPPVLDEAEEAGGATSDEAEEAGGATAEQEDDDDVAVGGGVEELAGGLALLLPVPPARGFCVMSTSCVPSAMGPLGLAGQDPGGLTGELSPNGIVPGWPTATPPTNTFSFAPAN